MKKKFWKNRIVKSCKDAGTYQPYFDSVITTLSQVLEERDSVWQQYEDEGRNAIVEYQNKGGATNRVKNPLLVIWDDLNKSALSYWRDLGLTPAGLKHLNEDAMKPKKQDSFGDILNQLGKELS